MIDQFDELLALVNNWATENCLILNAAKTQSILISKKNNFVPTNEIIVNNSVIPFSKQVKNLGIIIDNELSFKPYVNNLCQKSFFALKSIYQYKYVIPEQIKLTLADSLVLSILNYMDVVYGPFLTVNDSNRVQKIQNCCFRYALQVGRREHITPYIR